VLAETVDAAMVRMEASAKANGAFFRALSLSLLQGWPPRGSG